MLSVLYYITWVVLVIDCFLLIILILAQESKSQGLGGLGGGMDMSFGGHTQRKVKRTTAICSVVFAVAIIALLVLDRPVSKTSLPEGAPSTVGSASPIPSEVPSIPDSVLTPPANPNENNPVQQSVAPPAGQPAKVPMPSNPAPAVPK